MRRALVGLACVTMAGCVLQKNPVEDVDSGSGSHGTGAGYAYLSGVITINTSAGTPDPDAAALFPTVNVYISALGATPPMTYTAVVAPDGSWQITVQSSVDYTITASLTNYSTECTFGGLGPTGPCLPGANGAPSSVAEVTTTDIPNMNSQGLINFTLAPGGVAVSGCAVFPGAITSPIQVSLGVSADGGTTGTKTQSLDPVTALGSCSGAPGYPFSFPAVLPGQYSLTVTSPGYASIPITFPVVDSAKDLGAITVNRLLITSSIVGQIQDIDNNCGDAGTGADAGQPDGGDAGVPAGCFRTPT